MGRVFINVAEKPSIAKDIARHLSTGGPRKERGASQYNPNYFFDYNLNGENVDMIVTSVIGHIEELRFGDKWRKWTAFDPVKLLTEAEVIRDVADDKKLVARNIRDMSQNATDVALWLDCDREGEAICFEVLRQVQAVNRNIRVHRAVFSANTRIDIERAMNNLQVPDEN